MRISPIVVVACVTSLLLSACGPTTRQLAHDAWDCTVGTAPALISIAEPALEQVLVRAVGLDGKVDVASVKAASAGFVTNDARCIGADLIARLLAPSSSGSAAPLSSPLSLSPSQIDAVRAALLGARHFHTSSGDI